MLPLYYLISGMFHKDYDTIKTFTKNKINKLLIPFLFFYLTAYLIFYICNYLLPELVNTGASGILDVLRQRQYFNGPIWFILSLFWCSFIFYFISRLSKKQWIRAIIVLSCGSLGAYLGTHGVFLPCMLDVSLTAMPFYYSGVIFKQIGLLSATKFDKFNLLIAIALYGVMIVGIHFLGDIHIGFRDNRIIGNYYIILISTLCGVVSVLFLCKSIKTLPFLVFFGRFSIIPLATHHLIYRPLMVVIPDTSVHKDIVITLLTIVCCALLIPLCNRFIPWFVGHKNLIK